MLLIECSNCGRRELRGTRSIEQLENTPDGVRLTVSCRVCGERVVLGNAMADSTSKAC